MSGFWEWVQSWVVKKSDPTPPEPAKPLVGESPSLNIHELRVQQKQLQRDAAQLRGKAKEAKRLGKDREAAMLMKRWDIVTKKATQIDGMLFNLEVSEMTVDSAKTSVAMVGGLKHGNAQVRTALDQIGGAHQIEEITAEGAELMQQVQEIGRVLSNPLDVTLGVVEDDDELAREMERLDEELVIEELPPVPTRPIAVGGNGDDNPGGGGNQLVPATEL